jgi:hypothetical protein
VNAGSRLFLNNLSPIASLIGASVADAALPDAVKVRPPLLLKFIRAICHWRWIGLGIIAAWRHCAQERVSCNVSGDGPSHARINRTAEPISAMRLPGSDRQRHDGSAYKKYNSD